MTDPFGQASTGSAIVPTIAGIFSSVASNLAPADAMTALKPFTSYSVAETQAPSASVSDVADANNGLALNTVVRVSALIAYSRPSRRSVIPTALAPSRQGLIWLRRSTTSSRI